MYEDAIKSLCSLMDNYPDVFRIDIVDVSNIIINYTLGSQVLSEQCTSTQQMIEWLESNLISKQ